MKKFIKSAVLVLGIAMAGWTAYVSNCQEFVSDVNAGDIEALADGPCYTFDYYYGGDQYGETIKRFLGQYNTCDFDNDTMQRSIERHCSKTGSICIFPRAEGRFISVSGLRQ